MGIVLTPLTVCHRYGTIVRAYQREKQSGNNQYKTLARRDLRPHLIMSIAMPFFQQVCYCCSHAFGQIFAS